jgi:hypothetical protein
LFSYFSQSFLHLLTLSFPLLLAPFLSALPSPLPTLLLLTPPSSPFLPPSPHSSSIPPSLSSLHSSLSPTPPTRPLPLYLYQSRLEAPETDIALILAKITELEAEIDGSVDNPEVIKVLSTPHHTPRTTHTPHTVNTHTPHTVNTHTPHTVNTHTPHSNHPKQHSKHTHSTTTHSATHTPPHYNTTPHVCRCCTMFLC